MLKYNSGFSISPNIAISGVETQSCGLGPEGAGYPAGETRTHAEA